IVLANLEAGDAIEDVVRPAALAVLTVVHDVDADLGLLAHDLRDGTARTPLVLRRVLGRSREPSRKLGERLRTGEAPDVRGEDAVLASFHAIVPGRKCLEWVAQLAARTGRRLQLRHDLNCAVDIDRELSHGNRSIRSNRTLDSGQSVTEVP